MMADCKCQEISRKRVQLSRKEILALYEISQRWAHVSDFQIDFESMGFGTEVIVKNAIPPTTLIENITDYDHI